MDIHRLADRLKERSPSQFALLFVNLREDSREQIAGGTDLRSVPARLDVTRQAVQLSIDGRWCRDELGIDGFLVLVIVDRVLATEVAIEFPDILESDGTKRRGDRQRTRILRLEQVDEGVIFLQRIHRFHDQAAAWQY